MRVLIQMRPERDAVAAVIDPRVTVTADEVAGRVPGVDLDPTFAPVAAPRPRPVGESRDPLSLEQPLTFSMRAEDAGVLVRGTIQDYDTASRLGMLAVARPDIIGVYADPVITTTPTCEGDSPVGNWKDVENHLAELGAEGLEGENVPVAVLDGGINAQHLKEELGRPVPIDAARSWNPASVVGQPGHFDVGHGTMCAFDALIAAPKATLLDLPVMRSLHPGATLISGLLSDSVAASSHLWGLLEAMDPDRRALVVNYSFASFSPELDFPPGHPGNYSDNPAHPFNLMVTALDSAGADVLFAAGNCGRDCPQPQCRFPDRPIVGANSHPRALCVGGVDTRRDRVGYSSQGPGRLSHRKPDICAYTHFDGSHAFGPQKPDSGTSAACPVAAGVVAAIRSQWPVGSLSPSQMRTLLRRTADDRGAAGFDYNHGYGIVSAPGIVDALRRRRKNGFR
ncbi:S8 family serine peptidase [Streptomyces sp. NPDC057099]|uniref:S8 family peptidase n=1 Tax=Streptomyces sp. NPDC057099 TaxID=3346019 RepID=UPI00363882BA